jgi:hypothetical protein
MRNLRTSECDGQTLRNAAYCSVPATFTRADVGLDYYHGQISLFDGGSHDIPFQRFFSVLLRYPLQKRRY